MDRNISRPGQALIILVLGIMGLMGIVALAVDGGNAYAERRRAQNAADAAALAGALERINNNTSTWVNAVYASAAQNGFNNDGQTNTVRVFSPPADGTYAGNIEYIQVVITTYTKTYFASIIGIPEITNKVEATSRTTTPQYLPMFGGAAVVSLAATSDCDNFKAFWVTGEATLDLTGGGIFVNSNNPTCAFIEQGEGSVRIRDDHQIQIVGGASIQKPKLLTPFPPMTNVASVSYPPPFYMPKFGCSKQAAVQSDGHTMSPGNWDDTFPPPGVDTLASGYYCLNGDFYVGDGQHLSGNQVVIKMEHGRLHFSANAQINLSAPKGGDLAGLLIYQPQDNTNYMALNANAYSTIVGSILAPGAQIRIHGNSSSFGYHSQIIGLTIQVDGDNDIVFKIIEDQNYKALSFPQVQFSH
jgi:Flp pilus assembly protein TadG